MSSPETFQGTVFPYYYGNTVNRDALFFFGIIIGKKIIDAFFVTI
jgi:hypothetical protein